MERPQMKIPQKIYINLENAILVLCDVQKTWWSFCKPGGRRYFETAAQTVPGAISNICGLVERAREAGIPIIYIQNADRSPQLPEFSVFGRQPHTEVSKQDKEIMDEVKPHEGESVIQHNTVDGFHKTELDNVLNRLVPDPTRCYAVVVGGGLAGCVLFTVLGFFLRNYWTVVPLDCLLYVTDLEKRVLELFSDTTTRGDSRYINIFFSRSDLIEVSNVPAPDRPRPIPGR